MKDNSNKLQTKHPGEVLKAEFLDKLGISQYYLAKETGVPPRRINEIVLGKRGISADTALRLAKFFGNDVKYWTSLQAEYDLYKAKLSVRNNQIDRIKPYEYE
jgi:addiction module HigA family antidote